MNFDASADIRTWVTDTRTVRSYNRNMARKGIPKTPPAWFLREWMEVCIGKKRGVQAEMMRLTGWSKATMSQLYNDQQDMNSDYLRQACEALNLRQHEILMPPEAAMALRRFEQTAREIAKEPPVLQAVVDERLTGTR